MTQRPNQTQFNHFDMMIIRDGGRTESELESMVQSGFGFTALSSACAVAADGLYRLVVLLEAGARRSAEASHLRLANMSAS